MSKRPVPVSDLPKFLIPTEAAELLRTTRESLATQRCTGAIGPPYIKHGHRVLYDRDALIAWMSAQTQEVK